MAMIVEEHIDNWDDLSFRINDNFTHFNNYIFRGQANENWKLEPTLSRALESAGYSKNEHREITEVHLNKFKENIRGRVNLNLNSASDDELWSLGQHFGLYTTLLDWSRSPYVALFFALQNCKDGENGALYAIWETDISTIRKEKSGNQKNVHLVNPLTNYNDRLVNQRGLFIHIPTHINLYNWIKSSTEFDWVTMYKITFPSSIKQQALSALNNMNINQLSLFPDLYGSSEHTNYELMIEPYLQKQRDEFRNRTDW
ncbi:FRG domain-containing protein [Photobacterium kishitanii]|uniref:FRG domain-containing protein n=1 Tax=Photobacterium kishitanii TaxID=318456 RepID=UPI0004319EC7|nr:FRG domain-containing protein [Photobacterium kishitanii]CEO40776.1 conserved hypothetical protein [Photobacterium kishitanii]